MSTVNDATGDGSFEVQINSTQAVYQVPADKSVLEVLEDNGVYLPFACSEGICGTCVTGVLEGVPEHHDQFMTDEEHASNEHFTPCCSRAKSARLVLDL